MRYSQTKLLLLMVGATALFAAACTDLAGPHVAGRRYVGFPPSKNLGTTVDWYQCWSTDAGETWDCQYDHTDSNYGTPDYWDLYDHLWTTGDCSMVAGYCDGKFHPPTAGSSPYTAPRNTTRADLTDYTSFAIPTCPASPTASQAYKAYCAGHTPNTTELPLLNAALNRMRQIGGICGTLAAIGDAVLARQTLRIFPQGAYSMSGHAPVNGGSSGANSWAILSQDLTNYGYDATHYLWFQNLRAKAGMTYGTKLPFRPCWPMSLTI